MTTYSKAYGRHILAMAMMHGLLAAVPTFGSRAPHLSDPVPFTRGSNGTGGRRSAPSVLSMRPSHNRPHQGKRECLRRRVGGFHRSRRHPHYDYGRIPVALDAVREGPPKPTEPGRCFLGFDLAHEPDQSVEFTVTRETLARLD